MTLFMAANKVLAAAEDMIQESGSPGDLQVFQWAVRDGGRGLSMVEFGSGVVALSYNGKKFLCGSEKVILQIAGAIRILGKDDDDLS